MYHWQGLGLDWLVSPGLSPTEYSHRCLHYFQWPELSHFLLLSRLHLPNIALVLSRGKVTHTTLPLLLWLGECFGPRKTSPVHLGIRKSAWDNTRQTTPTTAMYQMLGCWNHVYMYDVCVCNFCNLVTLVAIRWTSSCNSVTNHENVVTVKL